DEGGISGWTGERQADPEARHGARTVPPETLGAANRAACVAGEVQCAPPGAAGVTEREVVQAAIGDLLAQHVEEGRSRQPDAPVVRRALEKTDIGEETGDLRRLQRLTRRNAAFWRQSSPPIVEP